MMSGDKNFNGWEDFVEANKIISRLRCELDKTTAALKVAEREEKSVSEAFQRQYDQREAAEAELESTRKELDERGKLMDSISNIIKGHTEQLTLKNEKIESIRQQLNEAIGDLLKISDPAPASVRIVDESEYRRQLAKEALVRITKQEYGKHLG